MARPQPAATVAARDREPGQSRVSRCVREQVSYIAKKQRIQGIHGPEIKSGIYRNLLESDVIDDLNGFDFS